MFAFPAPPPHAWLGLQRSSSQPHWPRTMGVVTKRFWKSSGLGKAAPLFTTCWKCPSNRPRGRDRCFEWEMIDWFCGERKGKEALKERSRKGGGWRKPKTLPPPRTKQASAAARFFLFPRKQAGAASKKGRGPGRPLLLPPSFLPRPAPPL